jgi:bifunctional N-acetylglucosamine-1-phosphate-uridyltransferase/glucosamine-1-phosphate-acetyltransferase GlmU-like protein
MADIRALVAAAGRGSRAGLPYPKTLFPIQGKPILLRIHEVLARYDATPTVIVSPDGFAPIEHCLAAANRGAHLVVQTEPRGMGDAVLQFERSPVYGAAEHVLLVWGDIPFLQPETVSRLVEAHVAEMNDFTFVTKHVASAYTVLSRDVAGKVQRLVETREAGIAHPQPGERDIGLFLFRKDTVLPVLREDLPGRRGRHTEEHGFLYVVEHLVIRGMRVVGLPVATELDLVSLNSLRDIQDYL